jgi:hypothetical protein
MGLDMSYQAIPADSSLLKKVSESENAAVSLNIHGFKEVSDEYLQYYGENTEFAEFLSETKLIRNEHSGIENRELYLGRRWDMLHYLLSEIRRNDQPYDESDLIHRAIHGGELLGDGVYLPQGVPVRYLNPQEVKEISKLFGQIETDSLEIYWNPPKMREAGVYKIRGDDSDNDQLYYLKEDFEKLKDFYLWAAIYDEAVLVFCD